MGKLAPAEAAITRRPRLAVRVGALLATFAVVVSTLMAFEPVAPAQAASPCGPDINAIVCENEKPGTDPYVWDIDGAGDPSIQGFATDISVNAGSRIDFKIDTDASNYTIDIYRTGWYQGLGARHIDSVTPSAVLPQVQPECISDVTTELYDCGTWAVSAGWDVPSTAVSGVYIASLKRADTGGQSHIIFIVRKDGNTSDVLFQTSDPTWHAYNAYGGSDFYQGAANRRAYKISYNRPFATRDGVEARDFYFASEYATVRFLERNGYDVSYLAGVDTDRRGGELLNHNVFLSVGHDEYWSGSQRANMEAARDAGVNMQFLTGNEGYWRTRYEPSVDASKTDYRTLVSYKETWSNTKLDPHTEWTGTWRDPRFADAAQGGHLPENSLTGTMYMVNNVYLPVTVNSDEGKYRLWRGTGLASMPSGTSVALADQTVGYESNEDIDNGFRPEGLIRLSTTVGPTPEYLLDYGNEVGAGTTEHHVTLYRAPSGALVFSSGSVQWGWGLDSEHDGDPVPADPRMQQAQVNLLADMGAQPGSLMAGLAPATASTDSTAPNTVINAPAEGAVVAHGSEVTITGTASDAAGRVAGVEVSTDGGQSWHPAVGTTNWSYSYIQQGAGATKIVARAIDDSANFAPAGVTRTVHVDGPYSVFGEAVPEVSSANDAEAVELGLRFTPQSDGFVTGVRFYKGVANTGLHEGSLWDAAGTKLNSVVFSQESADGWQTALFTSPVEVFAGVQYTVSYSAPNGGYSMTDQYWPYMANTTAPLEVPTVVGAAAAGVFGEVGAMPDRAWRESNYFVDVVFDSSDTSPLRAAARSPQPDASSIALDAPIEITFTRNADPATVDIAVAGASGGPVSGTVAYDVATKTARFTPAVPYEPATKYTVAPSARDLNGVGLDASTAWSFTTQAAELAVGECPCSLFPESARPAIDADADRDAVTLGVRFSVASPGEVHALKFFKGAGNEGPRSVSLWKADGTQLASAAVGAESSHGWQSVTLDQPVDVVPGETYIASYYAPHGRYAVTPSQFGSNGYTRGPLTVPADGGAFTYSNGFPDRTSSTNYFVDIAFTPVDVGPIVTSTSPVAGATEVAADATVSVTFSAPVAPGYVATARSGSTTIAGTWTASSDAKKLTFVADSDYAPGSVIAISVTSIVGANGVAGDDVAWSFAVQTAAEQAVTTIFGSTVPQVAAETDDSASVELGLAFRSAVAGEVRAIRFYKAVSNTGTHVGSIWSPTGERLAQVTFVGESASGWQRALLSQPVAIEPGLVYTVSYLAPRGNYSYSPGALVAPQTSGPLTTEAPTNGRFRYGSGGSMPTTAWNSTNYFVDVEFLTDVNSPEAPPSVSSVSPSRNASAVGVDSPITAAVDRVPSGAVISLALTGPEGNVAGTVQFEGATGALKFTAAANLAHLTTYTATVTIDGAALDSWSFRTVRTPVTGVAETIFGTEVPAVDSSTDSEPVEVGTAFEVAEQGTVTAIRFYKGVSNTGTHRGTLWSSAGDVLARVTFTGETASGWQRAELAEPVDVMPGQTYVVSYLAPVGRFAIAEQYFATPKVNGRLTAPAGDNGRFKYAADGGFPVSSWGSSGYFVDAEVVFADAPTPTPTPTPAPTPAPTPTSATVTAATPEAGASEVSPTTAVSAALDSDQAGATLQLNGPNGAVAGAVVHDAATRTVTFTPSEPLAWSTEYTVAVTVPGLTVEAGDWGFTTASEPVVLDAVSIFGDALPAHPAWDDPDGIQVATRFSVNSAGQATGVRFYKGAANNGAHTGYLWLDYSTKLAEVEFVDETEDGWQTALFAEPVALQPGVEYRVGVYSTAGHYAVDINGLKDPVSTGVFDIPAGGSSYTNSRGFPVSWSLHNYWVDVLFVPQG